MVKELPAFPSKDREGIMDSKVVRGEIQSPLFSGNFQDGLNKNVIHSLEGFEGSDTGKVVIGDLGVAFDKKAALPNWDRYKQVQLAGTLGYFPPEFYDSFTGLPFQGSDPKPVGQEFEKKKKVDSFALGMIMYNMLGGSRFGKLTLLNNPSFPQR